MGKIDVSPERMKQIEKAEYGISGTIGGLPRTRYYTPDGRVIMATANMREYHIKNSQGEIIGSGTRDANLDQGWLLSRPTVLKPFCKWCDKWHDTVEEVEGCSKRTKLAVTNAETTARQAQTDEVMALRSEVAELKSLLNKFMEVAGGKILQSESNGNAQAPRQESIGGAKEGV